LILYFLLIKKILMKCRSLEVLRGTSDLGTIQSLWIGVNLPHRNFLKQ